MNLVKKRCAYLIICLIMVFVCPTYQIFGMTEYLESSEQINTVSNSTTVGYVATYEDRGRIIIDSGDVGEKPSVIGPAKPIEEEKKDESKPNKPGFLVDTGDLYGGISILSLSILSIPLIFILKKMTEEKDVDDYDELDIVY